MKTPNSRNLIEKIEHFARLAGVAVSMGCPIVARKWAKKAQKLEDELMEIQKTETIEAKEKGLKIQCKTGSEQHTTEWRTSKVFLDGIPIWETLKPISTEWVLVGNKGNHGKYCVAEYELPPTGTLSVKFSANKREDITATFDLSQTEEIDIDGYTYNNTLCGWVVSI